MNTHVIMALAAALAAVPAFGIDNNIALGSGALQALQGHNTGLGNIGVGGRALQLNLGGSNNTALGTSALTFVQGDYNIALGYQAGFFMQRGNNNILIGNPGASYDNGTIYLGASATHKKTFIAGINGTTTAQPGVPVLIDANGQLGTVSSSRAVKEDIADMGAASALLMKLRPVTFRYKERPGWPLQYGLIAEEVAAVAPELAARGADGQVQTVYYQDLAPMLVNEYQKQQRVIAAQRERLEAEHARVDALERELAALKARLGWD